MSWMDSASDEPSSLLLNKVHAALHLPSSFVKHGQILSSDEPF